MVIFHGYVRFIFADLLSGPHHVADALSSFWTYLVPNDLNWLILLLGLKGQHESKGRTDRVNLVITSMYFLPSGLGLFAPRQDLSRVWPDPSGAAFLGRRSKRFWHCIGQAAQAKLDEISPSNHRSMCGWSPAATYGGKAVARCELLSQKSGSVCICICIYIYVYMYMYIYIYMYIYMWTIYTWTNMSYIHQWFAWICSPVSHQPFCWFRTGVASVTWPGEPSLNWRDDVSTGDGWSRYWVKTRMVPDGTLK